MRGRLPFLIFRETEMKANLTFRIFLTLLALPAISACGSDADVYSEPHRNAQFLEATGHYGPLVLSAKELKNKGATVESAIKPWSTWWYPVNEKFLFEKGDSPLQKFDRFARAHNRGTKAAKFEEEEIYSPDYPGWAGHCHAVAYAGVLVQPEPKGPVKLGGETFSTGDLKALAMKTYDNAGGFLYFGQRNRGSGSELKTDIYPDQFHRVLQAELFQKGRPIIVDKDPKYQVWNYPIYYASVNYQRKDKHTVEVYTILRGSSPHVDDYDFEGTRHIFLDYSYNLYGNENQHGDFEVLYGEWIKTSWGPDSTELHPDFVIALPDKLSSVVRSSKNGELDAALVDLLLEKAGSRAAGTIVPSQQEESLP